MSIQDAIEAIRKMDTPPFNEGVELGICITDGVSLPEFSLADLRELAEAYESRETEIATFLANLREFADNLCADGDIYGKPYPPNWYDGLTVREMLKAFIEAEK